MWPVELVQDEVRLRRLTRRDARAWTALRGSNMAWLQPWEATSPHGGDRRPPSFRRYVAELDRQGRAGDGLPFAIEVDGALAGQCSVLGIVRGSLWSASVGYWVGQEFAGRGVTPLAVAMVTDYCFTELGLHRMEVNIRPENAASLRVVAKLRFRDEGLRERYLHIQGVWADHRTFALTADEVPGGLTARARELRLRASEGE